MNNLLSAQFSRLWKDKTFWLCMGAMLVYALFYMLNGCRMAIANKSSGSIYILEQFYFHVGLPMGLFCAVFTSLFLGTEYGDGTVRNKLIAGHTRQNIYLANLTVSFTASLCMLLTWFLGGLIGVPILGFWKMGSGVLLYILLAVCFTAAFSAIFTAIAMLCPNRAISAVLVILVFLGLMLWGSTLYNRLSQPEFTNDVLITADGIQMGDPVPNPSYLTGNARKVYEFLLDVLPAGQGIQLFDLTVAHPLRMVIASFVVTAVTTMGGIFIFQRKNLK